MKDLREVLPALAVLVGMLSPLNVAAQAPAAQAPGSAQTERGKEWFYQRCSLCHVGRVLKNDTHTPMAPNLAGVLKDASAAREAAVREQIQRGSLRMPGFRYGLTPEELDELIAYLKTI